MRRTTKTVQQIFVVIAAAVAAFSLAGPAAASADPATPAPTTVPAGPQQDNTPWG